MVNFDLTDHYPIFLLLKTQTNCKNKMVNECRFDSAKFVDLVSRFDWGKLSQEPCVNKAFSTLTEKLTGIINSCTSVSTISRWYSAPRNPWITRGLLRSINKKDNLYKKVKLQPFNLSLRTRFKLYSQTLTVLLKKAKRTYYQNKVLENGNDSRKNWKVIKEFLHLDQPDALETEFSDGTSVLTCPVTIANSFNESFFSNSVSTVTNLLSLSRLPHSFFLKPTSPAEVLCTITSLKMTGCGLDSIYPAKIKLVARELSSVLSELINTAFRSGIFPTILKQGKVIPVFKKGDRKVFFF